MTGDDLQHRIEDLVECSPLAEDRPVGVQVDLAELHTVGTVEVDSIQMYSSAGLQIPFRQNQRLEALHLGVILQDIQEEPETATQHTMC